MTTVGLMRCKDEQDIIETTIRHLATQVDEILVADNLSSDGTRDILDDLARELPMVVVDDPDPAYYQSAKMTALAMRALDRGHAWGLFVDADEAWRTNDFRPVKDWIDGHSPDVQVIQARLYHHIPGVLDEPASCWTCGGTRQGVLVGGWGAAACDGCGGKVEPNAFRRIRWRKRAYGDLPKVAARLRPDLVVQPGNHGVTTRGTALTVEGLTVHHFSWRSPEQFLRKMRNGDAAYAATVGIPEGIGKHWRGWSERSDDAITSTFWHSFWSADPAADDSLTEDPAPFELCGVSPALRWPERTAR